MSERTVECVDEIQYTEEEPAPVDILLACPHDIQNPQLRQVLASSGWSSIIYLSVGNSEFLGSIGKAKRVTIVLSKCANSPPFVDMVLKVLRLTDDCPCERDILRLDGTTIPSSLAQLRGFPDRKAS